VWKEKEFGRDLKVMEIALAPGVLGLARTGLIFTGLQEGAQPGGGG